MTGWEVAAAEVCANGAGNCTVIPPEGRGRSLSAQQFAIICYAARAHAGWTADDGDRGDRWQAYEAVERLTNDPGYNRQLRSALQQQAKELAGSGKFKWIANRVAEALIERGKLDVLELGPLLRDSARDYRRLA